MGISKVLRKAGRLLSEKAGTDSQPERRQAYGVQSAQSQDAPRAKGASELAKAQAEVAPKALEEDLLHAESNLSSKRIVLPKISEHTSRAKTDVNESARTVSEVYPLITTNWKENKYTLASADVHFNPILNQLIYNVLEPAISKEQKELVQKTIEMLHDKLEIDFSKLTEKKEIYDYVDDQVDDIWEYLDYKPTEEESLKLKYHIYKEVIGLGKIEPIMRDNQIEDISCDGIGLPIYIFHRNSMYGEMPTNIWFDNKDELDGFVMKLAQKTGKTVSVAEPLLDSALPDGSRVQITYGTDIARKGSNFSIRKFFKVPLTVIDLVNYGTADALTLAYLWLAIEEQQSILVAGTTAVGKTTFLNSIAQFIRPSAKIVSIEDTSELNIAHTNWTPQVARSGFGPKKYGEISMFDLLKAALRQRPDYIIVGEVRGREASVLFQAMATGHASLSTIHADNISAVIDRLTTRPIDLPASLLENLDLIIFLDKAQRQGRLVRKVGQIIEVEGYDRDSQKLKTNESFHWVPSSDEFVPRNSLLLQKIATKHGWTDDEVKEEIMRRASVLGWLQNKKLHEFKDVAQIINMYYTDPKRLARILQNG